jgi:hypothetical protein
MNDDCLDAVDDGVDVNDVVESYALIVIGFLDIVCVCVWFLENGQGFT